MPFQQSTIRLVSDTNKVGSRPVTSVLSPYTSTENYSNNRLGKPDPLSGSTKQYSTPILPRSFGYVLDQKPLMSAHNKPSPIVLKSKFPSPFYLKPYDIPPILTPGKFCTPALPSPAITSFKDPPLTTSSSVSKLGKHQSTTAKPKRFRRKRQQIDRNYPCLHKSCSKAYGTLNHLNQHVVRKHDGNRLRSKSFLHTINIQMDNKNIGLEPQSPQKIQDSSQGCTLTIRHDSLPEVSVIDIRSLLN